MSGKFNLAVRPRGVDRRSWLSTYSILGFFTRSSTSDVHQWSNIGLGVLNEVSATAAVAGDAAGDGIMPIFRPSFRTPDHLIKVGRKVCRRRDCRNLRL